MSSSVEGRGRRKPMGHAYTPNRMAVLAVTEAYPAERAAPLAGVPKSTLHYWASNGIWTPSVSPEKVRLWSLSDLAMLRVIYWLRRADKQIGPDELPIPRTKMAQVRAAVQRVLGNELSVETTRVFVDAKGKVVLGDDDHLEELTGQQRAVPKLDVLSEYRVDEARGIVGPN